MLKGFSCGCVAVSSQRNVLRITSQSRRYISTMQKYEMPSLCCRTLLEKHLIVLKPVPIQIALTSQNRKQFSQAVSNNDDLGKLLYVGQEGSKLRKLLGSFYVFSIGTAAASPYLFKLASGSTFGLIFLGIEVFAFVFLNPILLYQFGKRYVNTLHYNKASDTYTAQVLSPLIYKDSRLAFSPKECKMPANPTVFTSFLVNKRPLFVNSDAMDYDHYMKMLRYASEFDFENPERQEQYSESIKSAVEQKQNEQSRQTNGKDNKK